MTPLRASTAPPAPEPVTRFATGQREEWQQRLPASAWAEVASALGLSEEVGRHVLHGEGDPAALAARCERPTGARIGVWRKRPWLDLLLGLGPAAVARFLGLGGEQVRTTPGALCGFVATFGLDAVEAVVRLPDALFDEALPALLPIGDARLAHRAARRWTQLGVDAERSAPAFAWLAAHPAHASWGLVAAALGDAPGPARAARVALRGLAERGLRAAIDDAAAAFGVEPATLLTEEVVALQPPAFFRLHAVRRPSLRSGEVMPEPALQTLVSLLLQAPADSAAFDEVKAACTEDSLAAFAIDVFESFRARTTSKSTVLWPSALAAFGGDAGVLALVSAMRDRDGRFSAPVLAAAACETLERIGSALALALLHALACEPHSLLEPSALQDAAEAALDRIARARALARSELEDAWVPHLGMDGGADAGSPDAGRILATKRLLAAANLARYERALVERRRWSYEAFRARMAAHPSHQEAASQLVWGAWDEREVLVAVLVLAGGELRRIQKPDEGSFTGSSERIGILHPLDLTARVHAVLSPLAQARKLQPAFAQLDRESFPLGAEEASSDTLVRFQGRTLSTRRLLPRGWRQATPTNEALLDRFERALPDGTRAVLTHSGIDMGDAPPRAVKLGSLAVWRGAAPVMLGSVHPVTMSELIRDVEGLASATSRAR